MICFIFKVIKIKSDKVSIIPKLLKNGELLLEWDARQVKKGESIGFEFDEDNLLKSLFHLAEVKE